MCSVVIGTFLAGGGCTTRDICAHVASPQGYQGSR
jgi:hypothetical protein